MRTLKEIIEECVQYQGIMSILFGVLREVYLEYRLDNLNDNDCAKAHQIMQDYADMLYRQRVLNGLDVSTEEKLRVCKEESYFLEGYIPAEYGGDYKGYLDSRMWRLLRSAILEMRGNRCELCGKEKSTLNVHHKTYDNLYHEYDHLDDLIVLCKECHSKFHDKLEES